jgi:hypothetical protein
MPDVQLSFRYAESDFVRACQAHHTSKRRLIFDAFLVIGFAALGVYRISNANDSKHDFWMGIVMISLSALLILFFVLACWVIPRYIFRHEPKFRDDYFLHFSDEGIHFRTANIDSHLQWSMYDRALITPHSYLLYYSKRQFTIVPKRFFENSEQQQNFENLVRNHISNIKTR